MKKKHQIFEHYRQNLNILRNDEPRIQMQPDREDIVICPLCYKFFTLDDLNNNILTIEHTPPGKLGGTADVLTCRDCNNTHGSQLESYLVKYIHSLDALSNNGASYIDTEVYVDGVGKFRANFRRSEDEKWELLAVPKASNTHNINRFTENFYTRQWKINLTIQQPNLKIIKVALIRIAYLIAFKYLGYGFLINFNLSRLRYQLNNPQKDVYPSKSVLFSFKCPDEFLGINILRNSKDLKCFLVIFDIQAQNSQARRIAVMLPGPNISDWNTFEKLDNQMTIHHFNIDFESKINTPLLSMELWTSVE